MTNTSSKLSINTVQKTASEVSFQCVKGGRPYYRALSLCECHCPVDQP